MAQEEKVWHPNFITYMRKIVSHPNYRGLPIKTKKDGSPQWIATAQSDVGKRRKKWAEHKANELGILLGPGAYAKVMYALHPTKIKVCQICGESMSISYIYPNVYFAKSIITKFVITVDLYDTVYDVWDNIVKQGFAVSDIVTLVNNKFETSFPPSSSKEEVLRTCEELCRIGGKSHLGPGAMSDFPDRFDGFHTYNRCHRPTEDKGRSKENLKSYTRDRRAYEYWSDGNIQAANQFMGSKYFQGISADHIGPISLGFVHDPHYLRPMTGSENSAKRDRLSKKIIEEVLAIQKQTGIYPMTWYSSVIWDFIVENYKSNEAKISDEYRNLLKQNISNYMYILREIMLLGKSGEKFLIESLISPKKVGFLYNYEFDELGNITSKSRRNITGRAIGEFLRFARIAMAAVVDYSEKDNRTISHSLTDDEKQALASVLKLIVLGENTQALSDLKKLISSIQYRLISA